ncbi:helix-turn-helix transcriptional regulator [Paenalkalicoccus suaedae]|uniref:Helix-turn-helix transcriptional regulator n=1 Tax=Paenalkalicoccus suaedae TaxID=2592382 RepID=A0A859FA55_9BACI|nr:helix-turn-helix transcriptional regulator [Paenalkalicoccus suaedae]QKS69668.1 helix-turn-helix transcriptional regulator [Paenalkalicoccus suaedae]
MEEQLWGRRIRAFRKLKGMTQEDLASKVGVSVSVLGDVERGVRMPEEKLLKQVTKTLGVTYAEFTSIK